MSADVLGSRGRRGGGAGGVPGHRRPGVGRQPPAAPGSRQDARHKLRPASQPPQGQGHAGAPLRSRAVYRSPGQVMGHRHAATGPPAAVLRTCRLTKSRQVPDPAIQAGQCHRRHAARALPPRSWRACPAGVAAPVGCDGGPAAPGARRKCLPAGSSPELRYGDGRA